MLILAPVMLLGERRRCSRPCLVQATIHWDVAVIEEVGKWMAIGATSQRLRGIAGRLLPRSEVGGREVSCQEPPGYARTTY